MSSTDFCIEAVSDGLRGRLREYMSLWLLEPTLVTPTWKIFSAVPLRSGIMLNTPMEPVNVLLSEKILSQLLEIQYPPEAA